VHTFGWSLTGTATLIETLIGLSRVMSTIRRILSDFPPFFGSKNIRTILFNHACIFAEFIQQILFYNRQFIDILNCGFYQLIMAHLNNNKLTFKSFKLNLSLVGAISFYRSTPYWRITNTRNTVPGTER